MKEEDMSNIAIGDGLAAAPRQWVPHSERVFSVPGLLSGDECTALIELAEQRGFDAASVRTAAGQQLMRNVRNNERAQFAAPSWITVLWERLSDLPLPRLDGQVAVGLPKELRFYKYSAGQRFKMHKDGPWTEGGMTSRLTLLVYLNQDFEGGETDFREFKVVPQQGCGLLFIHDTWHEGVEVGRGMKYVLRSDVIYGG